MDLDSHLMRTIMTKIDEISPLIIEYDNGEKGQRTVWKRWPGVNEIMLEAYIWSGYFYKVKSNLQVIFWKMS